MVTPLLALNRPHVVTLGKLRSQAVLARDMCTLTRLDIDQQQLPVTLECGVGGPRALFMSQLFPLLTLCCMAQWLRAKAVTWSQHPSHYTACHVSVAHATLVGSELCFTTCTVTGCVCVQCCHVIFLCNAVHKNLAVEADSSLSARNSMYCL